MHSTQVETKDSGQVTGQSVQSEATVSSKKSTSEETNLINEPSNSLNLLDGENFDSVIRPRSSSLTESSIPKELVDLSKTFTFEPVQSLDLDPALVHSITSSQVLDEEISAMNENSRKEENPEVVEELANMLSKSSIEKAESNFSTPEISPTLAIKTTSKKASGSQETEFDYTQFLDQIRSPQALPLVRYLENFVREFDKKPWTVRDQVKIVGEFTDFVLGKMLESGIWEEEPVEYLQEGVEQYLMNRLHNKAFSPLGSDDRERDHVLHQRARYFRWIEEKHLDIHLTSHRGYLATAQQELIKLNNFKTPRHKMICILNCCKLIFKLLRRNESSACGADSFLPLLIFTILKANPPKLISNLQYISRFRHPSRLQSEAGYYLTNLVGAIQFIEGLEPASLTISREEFDANIEKTLKELSTETPQGLADTPLAQEPTGSPLTPIPPQPDNDILDKGTQLAQRIKRPLDLVGKFFSEVASPVTPSFSAEPLPSSSAPKSDRLPKKKSFLGSLFASSSSDEEDAPPSSGVIASQGTSSQQGQELISFETTSHPSALEASPNLTLNEKLHLSQSPEPVFQPPLRPGQTVPNGTAFHFNDGMKILRDMFPSFDNDVLQAVVGSQRGDLGASVEALLEMSAPDANDLISFSTT